MSSGADRTRLLPLALLLAAALLTGVACLPASPEEQVRRLLQEAADAARKRDLAGLETMLSDRYRDPAGNGKREALGLLRFHLGATGSIHLLERIHSVRRTGPSEVEARVLVAAAAVPIHDLRALDRITADVLVFDLRLEREGRGRWRVVEARWRRAGPADLV